MAGPYVYPMEGYLTVAEYAKTHGVSVPTMHEYVKLGRLEGAIKYDQRGRVNVDKALADKALEFKSPKQQVNQHSMKNADTPGNEWNTQYAKARSAKEIINLQKAQIELEELRGSLVAVEKVEREQFLMARILRDQIMGLPARLSSELSAMTDATLINNLLLAEFRQIFEATITRATEELEKNDK